MSLIIIMKWCGYLIKIMEHEFFKYYVMSLHIVDYWHIEFSDCENIKLENMFSIFIFYNSHKTTLDHWFSKLWSYILKLVEMIGIWKGKWWFKSDVAKFFFFCNS
jgi:hypothetical protein